eukprot:TRINITY_DN18006_c0_g1_i2.p1 TRINITY_DN18006_c0_g1~~TRINITY_DN18006_c0_g1_i2.p1  ORF type:complete len:609 (-),score=98.96 TRINITY_DN18006_c0_g1_i2:105-1931(-)
MPALGGVDVAFSDDRFLQRVLQEATQRGAADDAKVLKRLEGLGFSRNVAQIALSIAGGEEKRAVEICMSGLAFTNNEGVVPSAGVGVGHSRKQSANVRVSLSCYICGGRHLSKKSLEFHMKSCKKRFLQREELREPAQRRCLLDEAELPAGVTCLEDFYALADGQQGAPAEEEHTKVSVEVVCDALVPCQYCARTFRADRVQRHQRACTERPRLEEAPRRPQRRSVGGGTCTATKRNSFSTHTERCHGCGRQFRPEVLSAHLKVCNSASQTVHNSQARQRPPTVSGVVSSTKFAAVCQKSEVIPRWPGAVTPPAPPPPRGRTSVGGSAASPFKPPSRLAQPQCAPSRARSPSLGSVVGTRSSPSMRGRGGGSSTATREGVRSSPTFEVERRGGNASQMRPDADEMAREVALAAQSSEALVAKGDIAPASEEDEAVLRAEFEESFASATIVGVFEARRSAQRGIYDAMRASMQESDPTCAEPAERELWHGTSWEIVTKILRQGFNRSFAGRHGTLLGGGTYFSVNCAYSGRFCDRRGGGRDNTKVMLLARVLVGKYCKGAPTDAEPPVMDLETGERFASTVDNEEQPSMFAVFRDFQAIPLFLVEYVVS